MPGSTGTTGSWVLKNIYLPLQSDQLNNKRILWKYPKKDATSISGRYVVAPVHLRRNPAGGFMSESGTLQTAGYQGGHQTQFPARFCFWPISVSDPMMAMTRDDKGSWVKALASEVKGATNDMGQYLNVLAYGNGTGRIAKCALTTNSTALNVMSNRHIDINAVVDIISAAGAEVATDLTVSAKSGSTIVTVSSAQTTAITDIVVKANSYNVSLMGLGGMVSTSNPPSGNFEGIDRATYSEWSGNVSQADGSARTLTLEMTQLAFNTVDRHGGNCNLVLSNYGPRQQYANLLVVNKRHIKEMTLEGGFDALEVNGQPWVADFGAPFNTPTNGTVYFLSLSELVHFHLKDFFWLEDDGGNILQRNGINWEAVFAYYGEFGTLKPNAHYKLDDIITSAEIE